MNHNRFACSNVGPEQAGCHGKTEVAGQRDGLVGDELRYRELDDALGLTALAGDVLADARTGKNGRHAVAIGVRPSRWLTGQTEKNSARADVFRVTADSGHRRVLARAR